MTALPEEIVLHEGTPYGRDEKDNRQEGEPNER